MTYKEGELVARGIMNGVFLKVHRDILTYFTDTGRGFLKKLDRFLQLRGVIRGKREISKCIEDETEEFLRGFLRGIFDVRGCVECGHKNQISISNRDADFLISLQGLLGRIGVGSHILYDRIKAGVYKQADRRGNITEYTREASHTLRISGTEIRKFAELIGFTSRIKRDRLSQICVKNLREKRQ
jgi:intein-encoded DNA endonuclease-like protein